MFFSVYSHLGVAEGMLLYTVSLNTDCVPRDLLSVPFGIVIVKKDFLTKCFIKHCSLP